MGRTPVILRWANTSYSPAQLERAERFMHRYEGAGIFFARLLPVLAPLISIPAGIIRMVSSSSVFLTTIGAAIWCALLAWLGGKVGDHLRASGLDPAEHPASSSPATKHEVALGYSAQPSWSACSTSRR